MPNRHHTTDNMVVYAQKTLTCSKASVTAGSDAQPWVKLPSSASGGISEMLTLLGRSSKRLLATSCAVVAGSLCGHGWFQGCIGLMKTYHERKTLHDSLILVKW